MNEDLKPQMTEDELAHMKGQEAEAFVRFFDEGTQYFKGVMADCQKMIVDEIMGLGPHQTEQFTVLKAQLDALYIPLRRVYQDVESGKMAWARMNGVIDKTQGIL